MLEIPMMVWNILITLVFVPILVKALQEADAKIEALTTRITALEG